MFYTIYSITNKLSGQIYIGKHKTKNINDDYMGSGKLITRAIKKYGKENFIKQILFVFDNKDEMDQKEKELVNELFILSENSYNLALGGKGGWDISKSKVAFLGKKHSEISKNKISKFVSENNPMFSEEARKKNSDKQKGIPRPNVSLKLKNKPKSEQHRLKISEAIKRKHLERKMGSGAIGSADDSES